MRAEYAPAHGRRATSRGPARRPRRRARDGAPHRVRPLLRPVVDLEPLERRRRCRRTTRRRESRAASTSRSGPAPRASALGVDRALERKEELRRLAVANSRERLALPVRQRRIRIGRARSAGVAITHASRSPRHRPDGDAVPSSPRDTRSTRSPGARRGARRARARSGRCRPSIAVTRERRRSQQRLPRATTPPGRRARTRSRRRAATAIAARAPGRGTSRVERVRDRAGRARLASRATAASELFARHGRAAARLTVAVERPLLAEREPEPRRRLAQHVVAGQDELRAELDDDAVVEAARVDATADAVARLEDGHVDAGAGSASAAASPAKPAPTTTTATGGHAPRGSAG